MADLKTFDSLAKANVKTYGGLASASWKTWNTLTVPSGAYTVEAVDFDGTNDYMTRGADLTGNADGKVGLLSFWARLDAGDGSTLDIINNGTGLTQGGIRCSRNTANRFTVVGRDSAGTAKLQISSNTDSAAGATWLNVLASWDLTDTAKRHFYLNDATVLSVVTYVDATLDYTKTNFAVGAGTGGAQKLNGCLAELYFNPTVYMDLSVEANRRKFISATGKPVNLGSDGSTPTGTAPIMYQRVADGAAASTFATNLGSGGNFSITGSLDIASTSPSD